MVPARVWHQGQSVLASPQEPQGVHHPTVKNQWSILHDNAPAHIAQPVKDWFQDNDIQVVPHARYSLDLLPCDNWIFAELKRIVAGIRHQNVQDMMDIVDAAIKSVPAEKWAAAMDRYPDHCRKCILAGSDYFEWK